ncbi:hypothetical protein GVN21_13335 [Caulobacter sp. SLTY]|uniref:M10 family metallopeptidase C-terminal domain-containing protein n=1 Tax=Caulobacter sp. SLTY TaxID=2683262 RepID=UPI0014135BBE|nr:M10 family metallopeptidase C-terminal domain-containing protein [Caulobacter sp. SLTY]NBB16343.1 hypothetical protein [Caulobacter sp. SLTY]
MPFAATFNLSSIDGTNGVRLYAGAGDLAGQSVSGVGDINGDGIADFIVGAPRDTPSGPYSGSSFVVFGNAAGLPHNIDLATLDGSNGFRLQGGGFFDYSGYAVSSAGDFNGDGFDDLVVGARGRSTSVYASGAVYVVFGSGSGFPNALTLSSLGGSAGLVINGYEVMAKTGISVSSAGDVNGDGIDDLIIGASYADGAVSDVGAAYVVFGQTTAFIGPLDLGGLDGTNGFKIAGVLAREQTGYSVSSAGDINGDGFGDVIVGAWRAGQSGAQSGSAYVVFGSDSGFPALINASALSGSAGFRIDGVDSYANAGISVASVGDVNGDGIDDVMIGASGEDFVGAAYVVFGSTTGFPTDLDLSSIDGTNGFKLTGVAGQSAAGFRVASAGDVNGDGRGDLVLTSPYFNDSRGAAFVLYGNDAGFGAVINLAALNGTNGFRIEGGLTSGHAGWSVAGAGDVNGDGIDDLVVGAPFAAANGSSSGAAYVIYGQQAPVPIVLPGTGGDDDQLGGDAADTLSGGGGNDILNGGLGADRLIGGTGDDTYYVDNAGDVTDETGGDGVDLVYSTVNWTLAAGFENLTLTGSAAIDGAGNSQANILTGNDGANTLDGGDGADRLYGGLGADDLVGGAGGDLLDGGVGADQMAGGTGDDTYVVDDENDTVTEAAGQGSERVRASVSFTLSANVENLQLTGSGSINGTGNGEANQIDGNSGNNVLSGGGGNDLIRGGLGDDELFGDDGSDQLLGGDGTDILHGGAGVDILQGNDGGDLIYGDAGTDNLDGGAGNDVLQGGDGADQLQGGDGVDQLYGSADNDILRGGAGNDSLYGGAGDDTYYVEDTSDTLVEALNEGTADTVRATIDWTLGDNFERLIIEGAGHWTGVGNALGNTITGNAGWNYLEGRDGNDTLNGGLGNDLIAGGLGSDILIGGGGEDRFITRQESVFTSSNPQGRLIETDTISDYVIGEDIVDLSVIDANAVGGGVNDAFTIVGAFDGQAGRMTLTFAGGITTLSLDIDGDRSADYRLRINGDVRADTADWVL